MDYITSEKPVVDIAVKWNWTRLIIKKKKNNDLRNYIGYVGIPGLNNGQKVFINKGFVITDVDI